LVILVAGIFFLYQIINRAVVQVPVTPTQIPEAKMQVVVTTHDIALGDVFETSDLTTLEVQVDAIPRDAMTEPDSVVGKYTKYPLTAGQMVLNHQLADPNHISHDLAFILQDDVVMMAFPASDLMSGLNIIQRGDIIDIYVTMTHEAPVEEVTGEEAPVQPGAADEEEEMETRTFTFDAFQRVDVTALVVDVVAQPAEEQQVDEEGVPVATPIPGPNDANVLAYLFALDPQDALLLKYLKDTGANFDFVLRSPTSTQYFELEPIIEEFIIDRYQLEITK